MTLDNLLHEMCETHWSTTVRSYPGRQPSDAELRCMIAVIRKHVVPLLADAHKDGMDEKHRALPRNSADYAEAVISQIINERSNEEERRA